MNHIHPPLGRRIKLLQRVKISSLLRDLVLTLYRIELNNTLKPCFKLANSFQELESEISAPSIKTRAASKELRERTMRRVSQVQH